ncbi:hypothetical protein, partial [Thiohalocapsa marina]|uniref:hypothetical protein n=1 Tax=Thiohalocapsa marina TaxID=424902 RepID=UPI0036D9C519
MSTRNSRLTGGASVALRPRRSSGASNSGRALGALVALRPGRSSRANVARQADVALRSGGASCASGPRLALRASR